MNFTQRPGSVLLILLAVACSLHPSDPTVSSLHRGLPPSDPRTSVAAQTYREAQITVCWGLFLAVRMHPSTCKETLSRDPSEASRVHLTQKGQLMLSCSSLYGSASRPSSFSRAASIQMLCAVSQLKNTKTLG